jgi:phosphoribosylamine--glycine ligase
MKVLVVGGGGREHALAWKLAQSERAEKVFVAPGNAGTAKEAGIENVPIDPMDIPGLVRFAGDRGVGLTIVGPEAPLCDGIVDAFEAARLRCFGPRKSAACLEASKAFAKDFMIRHRIPTARHKVFSRLDEAVVYLGQERTPIVVKASGLAAGKGVVIALDDKQAIAAVESMLAGEAFGEAGREVVIEEYLHGEEASFTAVSDGQHILALASSQDHKARDDGDSGPNTGGMGAYSPAPVVTSTVHARIMEEIVIPAIRGMAQEHRPYTGFLYAGLMIRPDGAPLVLEFNCRLGDPETQPLMLRLRSDLIELCEATLSGALHRFRAEWDPRPALGVVLAAAGYPGNYRKGDRIFGLKERDDDVIKVFHAGTAIKGNEILTAGGRVLCVCALGESITDAKQRAYQRTDSIHWDGMYYRRDIGHRAVARVGSIAGR